MCKCKSEEHLGNFGDCSSSRMSSYGVFASSYHLPDNLKLTFDGETLQLKSVEIIK